jgi:hypothetical protein
MLRSRRFANWLWGLCRKAGAGPWLLRFHPKSALVKWGWFTSFRSNCPVDSGGQAVPWWNYAAVNFLESRLQRAHRVLEFGSGYSTLWLAQRVREMIALEDNERWVALVARQLPPNARVIHVGAFTPEALSAVTDLGLFDFVVVDCNGDRLFCAQEAVLRFPSRSGVLFFDNTDDIRWADASRLLGERGFREIFFVGMAPQVISMTKGSLFYRAQNCLGI